MKEFLRIITALIFIASGFVKAIDVKGFSFKLEEYFSPSVFNMPFSESIALPIAIFVVALELLLGFMLLMKIRMKFTLATLIALCVFFAFLTFYSAYFNKVTDCGCFGDAMKFTPWQSFIKDIILLALLIILWFMYRYSFNMLHPKSQAKYIALSVFTLAMGLVVLHGILHEPLIDFRDYKTGTNLKTEKEKIRQNPDVYKTFYVLKNKKTGAEKKVNQDEYVNVEEYWEEGSPWEILSDRTVSEVVNTGYASEIKKFRPEDENGNDLSDKLIGEKKVNLIFIYKPAQVSEKEITDVENYLKKLDAPVYGIAPQKGVFKTIPNLIMDATPIKTIARSNPFVVTLQNGVIIEKKPLADFMK